MQVRQSIYYNEMKAFTNLQHMKHNMEEVICFINNNRGSLGYNPMSEQATTLSPKDSEFLCSKYSVENTPA